MPLFLTSLRAVLRHSSVVTVTLALCAASALQAQSAADIMKKTSAIYTNAKTYQATYLMDTSMGSFGSLSTTIEMKVEGSQKFSARIRPSGKSSGQLAMAAAALNMLMLDDGNHLYAYTAAMNQYYKGPHVGGAANSLMPKLGDPANKATTYKLLPAATVDGTPVYAIQINTPGSFPSGPTVFYIDKATYHIKQFKTGGQSPTGQGQNTLAVSVTTTVKNEKFNAPLADSLFKFTPPAGATQTKNFPGMMGGGLGGLPPGH